MKNLLKCFMIIGLIGFLFFACRKDSLDQTTWKLNMYGSEVVFQFNYPKFIMFAAGNTIEGSYSFSGNTVTLKDEVGRIWTGKLKGKILSLNIEGAIMAFTRQ